MSKRKPAAASKRALSSRKPATAPKRAGGQKVVARAQRNKQAFVKSPKDNPLRFVAAASSGSPIEADDESKQQSLKNENRAAALQAILQAAFQDGFGQKMRDNNPKKGFDFPLLIANVQAYQARLLEVTQANIQFIFEFNQRLATTRSPLQLLALITEFTGRRIIMTLDAVRGFATLPGR